MDIHINMNININIHSHKHKCEHWHDWISLRDLCFLPHQAESLFLGPPSRGAPKETAFVKHFITTEETWKVSAFFALSVNFGSVLNNFPVSRCSSFSFGQLDIYLVTKPGILLAWCRTQGALFPSIDLQKSFLIFKYLKQKIYRVFVLPPNKYSR